MKTVKEVALELEVSQVTVYNHLKKLDKELKGNIFKMKGATHLDNEAIKQIKISMGLLQVPTIKKNISSEEIIAEISNNVAEQVSNKIKKDYEELRDQVEELREQNNYLIDLIKDKQKKTILQKMKGLFRRDLNE